jgi:hypothetical protein
VQAVEERRERGLRLGVDAGRRLVEHEQRRLAGERLRDERALLLAAGEPAQRRVRAVSEADALDRLVDDRTVAPPQRPQQAPRREPPRGDDLADGGGRARPERRALRQVAERRTSREAMRRLAEEQGGTGRRPLEAEHEPDERRLAAAVGSGDGHELARLDGDAHVLEHGRRGRVGERDVAELDR